MSVLPRLKLVSSQPEPDYASTPNRYLVHVSGRATAMPAVRVYDRARKQVVLRWHGQVARRLLDSKALPLKGLSNGSHDCDKAQLQTLALAAASIQMERERHTIPGRPGLRRVDGLDEKDFRMATTLHHAVLALLFDHAQRHLAAEEVVFLMLIRCPSITACRIEQVLDDLVRWSMIQRITVDADSVYYDTDMREHLHVFDARTRELRDAPASGVLLAN